MANKFPSRHAEIVRENRRSHPAFNSNPEPRVIRFLDAVRTRHRHKMSNSDLVMEMAYVYAESLGMNLDEFNNEPLDEVDKTASYRKCPVPVPV